MRRRTSHSDLRLESRQRHARIEAIQPADRPNSRARRMRNDRVEFETRCGGAPVGSGPHSRSSLLEILFRDRACTTLTITRTRTRCTMEISSERARKRTATLACGVKRARDAARMTHMQACVRVQARGDATVCARHTSFAPTSASEVLDAAPCRMRQSFHPIFGC